MLALRIAYCTNVHAGADAAATLDNLERHAARVRELVHPRGALGIGLWLSARAAADLSDRDEVRRFRDEIERLGLEVLTLNGFPYGDFHESRVKRAVYEPHWAQPERLRYTTRLAEILVDLLPRGVGCASISTVPIGWRAAFTGEIGAATVEIAAAQLEQLAERLARIEEERGLRITVDLEPEPGCLLDRAQHVVDFFDRALQSPASRRHLGVCHDICHAAVMFERQEDVLARYEHAGIRVGKVQVSSALEADGSPASLASLARFDEERYLHQTTILDADGEAHAFEDLAPALKDRRRGVRRTHFHVPIHLSRIGPLLTTQSEIDRCLRDISRRDPPILEIETYAWSVLPEELRPPELAQGIAAEWRWLEDLLA